MKISGMDHLDDESLANYLLGCAGEDHAVRVEEHLDSCATCCERAASFQPRDELTVFLRCVSHTIPPSFETVAFVRRDQQTSVLTDSAADLVGGRTRTVPSGGSSPGSSGLRLAECEIPIPAVLHEHPKYRVIRLLGQGGMGHVWLAEHLTLGRLVALKMLSVSPSERPEFSERFQREIQLTARLQHPNIVTVYDAESLGESSVLVMEYIDGETLACAASDRLFGIGRCCAAVQDAAAGLAHAHAHRLVHRDVKPGNLIQTREGVVKVLDFGLVTSPSAGSLLTATSMVMGTPEYMSPEQAENPQQADARSDLYSLGCTLYHLLSGRVPFCESSVLRTLRAHQDKSPEPIEGLPEGLWEIIERLLQKKPADRFQSAWDVVEALDPYCDHTDAVRLAPRLRSQTSEGNVPASIARPRQETLPEQTLPQETLPEQAGTRPAIAFYRRRSVVFWGLAMTSLLLFGAVYRIQTDQGVLVIESLDDSLQVTVKQNGRIVTIVDSSTGAGVKLRSGRYQLESQGGASATELSLREFEMTRGEVVIAKISQQRPLNVIPLDVLAKKYEATLTPEEIAEEIEKWQGEWEMDGQPNMIIKGHVMSCGANQSTIVPTHRKEHFIQITQDLIGGRYRGSRNRPIVRVQGDVFEWCSANAPRNGVPPEDFVADQSAGYGYFKFHRVKPQTP